VNKIESINDPFIKINGIDEGSKWNRFNWYQVRPDFLLSEEESKAIEFYKLYMRELVNNIEDAGLGSQLRMSLAKDNKVRISSNFFPGKHRSKSIFLDFRHFVATKSPCEFHRLCNILKKSFHPRKNPQLHIEFEKSGFLKGQNKEIKLFGQSISQSELIETWFNTQYFHADNNKRLSPIRSKILEHVYGEDVIHLLLYVVLINLKALKSIYAMVKDYTEENQLLNLPDDRWIDVRAEIENNKQES
jgi:hypothetical protein